jgi:hypothetical protein
MSISGRPCDKGFTFGAWFMPMPSTGNTCERMPIVCFAPECTSTGRAVQVHPIKPMLKPPGTKHLRLKCDEQLSSFAFKFNSCRYTPAAPATSPAKCAWSTPTGRGLHSFPFPLNLSLLCPFPLNLSLLVLCPPYDPN